MFEKLEELENKYEELNKKLSDPKIISNQYQFQEYSKLQSNISKVVLKYIEYKNVAKEIEENLKKGRKIKLVGRFLRLVLGSYPSSL